MPDIIVKSRESGCAVMVDDYPVVEIGAPEWRLLSAALESAAAAESQPRLAAWSGASCAEELLKHLFEELQLDPRRAVGTLGSLTARCFRLGVRAELSASRTRPIGTGPDELSWKLVAESLRDEFQTLLTVLGMDAELPLAWLPPADGLGAWRPITMASEAEAVVMDALQQNIQTPRLFNLRFE